MRTLFSILLIFSLTLPLFQVQNNNTTDQAVNYIKEELLVGSWGMVAKKIIDVSEDVIKKEKKSRTNVFINIKQSITSGYGIGFSSIGAVLISWNNYRFKRFELVPALPLFIVLIILVQVFFHNYFYRKKNAILSVLNMLLVLSIFGNCIKNEYYSGYLVGILLFILIQVFYMIYFYWFPYKEITVGNDENQ